jgi:hypothetical protein
MIGQTVFASSGLRIHRCSTSSRSSVSRDHCLEGRRRALTSPRPVPATGLQCTRATTPALAAGSPATAVITLFTIIEKGRHRGGKTQANPKASSADVKPVQGVTHHSQKSEASLAS